MQKITLLQVGRPKTPWISEGIEQFSKRLRFSFDFRVIEITPSKSTDQEKQKEEESLKVLEHVQKLPGEKILMDEKGSAKTSVEFSKMLSKAKDTGVTLIFILGGSFGLTEAAKKACNSSIQLSDFTFSHELCALIFLEQLYRAAEIEKGSGYHH